MTREQFIDRTGHTPPALWQPKRVTKPDSCKQCPLYESSTWYVPDEVHSDSTLFILQSTVGAEDERHGLPLIGKTGDQFNTTYLPKLGYTRGPGVSVGSAIRCRYTQKLSTVVQRTILEQCNTAHLRIPETVTTIILNGQLALNYATSQEHTTYSLTDWRGFLLPAHRLGASRRCFVTNITSSTHGKDLAVSLVSDFDIRRLGEVLRGRYPSPPPPWHVNPEIGVDAGTRSFFTINPEHKCTFAIDTEFIPGTGTLTILGIAKQVEVPSTKTTGGTPSILRDRVSTPGETPNRDGCVRTEVLSVDWQRSESGAKSELSALLARAVALPNVTTVFHNAMADIPVIEKACGIGYQGYAHIEDTMLAHAVLWCEFPHTLEFLASIYGQYGKYKHLKDSDELLYNYGDVIDTLSVWNALSYSFKSDTQAEHVYRTQSLALLPILLESKKQGIRVNKQRVIEVFNEYYALTQRIHRYAQLSVGYPLNLNSGDQLKHYLYTVRGYPVQIDKDTKRPTTDDDAINRLRAIVLPGFDTSAELTFDRDADKSYSVLTRVANGADPVLEARALWGSAWHTVNNYIVGLCHGVYGEYNKGKRKKAREQYWKTGVTANDVVDRIYPNFAIHAQKTGRWSTTDPPLAQLPSDLRDIICPDPDELCVSWDWSAIEPRVLQALTGSVLLKRTFDDNFDLHTWTVCYMFGYEFPPDLVDPHKSKSCEAWRVKYNWKGKDDPRRVFAKQGRYEMWYGGTGSNAAQSAASFGLNAKDLKVALAKLASSDPAYYTWKVQTEAEVKRTALVRTFMGRPRRFLSTGDQRRREGLDQPMQGAVSDIFNTTAVLLKREHPSIRWGWGMHDSQKWYIKQQWLTPARFDAIKATVERTHLIAGQVTRFPGDFEIILPPEQGNQKFVPYQYFETLAHAA